MIPCVRTSNKLWLAKSRLLWKNTDSMMWQLKMHSPFHSSIPNVCTLPLKQLHIHFWGYCAWRCYIWTIVWVKVLNISQEQKLSIPELLLKTCTSSYYSWFSLCRLSKLFLRSIRQLWKRSNFFTETVCLVLVLWQHEAQGSRLLFIVT